MLKPLFALCLSLSIATPAASKPLKIVTDIAPIYSLVSQITGETDNLTLLLDSGASPHDYAMKPSHAKDMQTADLIVFTGFGLTPWIEKPLETLGKNAIHLSLMDTENTFVLDFRKSVVFEEYHDDDHDVKHEDDRDDAHGHHHGNYDPHGWMDPENAMVWLNHIAQKLSKLDPENAEKYNRNNGVAQQNLTTLQLEVTRVLAQSAGKEVLFFHDAYQYFEHRFDIAAVGAITLADDAKVTPKQLRTIERLFEHHNVQCVLTEPATKTDWINNLAGANVKQTPLDPLGATFTLGPDLYGQMIKSTAKQIANCLKAT
jgi:zinc transport system substrate-binding protein